MNFIYAYNRTSELEMEDISSFSIFLKGCNLSCPYCMNNKLISANENKLDDKILKDFKSDVKKINPQMIFISGGEPTHNYLALFWAINLIKSLKCKIGMSTNGTNPIILKKIIKDIDYIAMDLKGDVDAYRQLGNSSLFMKILYAWSILREEVINRKNFHYEIRTTLFPPFVNKKVLENLSKLFEKNELWVLQQFRVVNNMPCDKSKEVVPYTEEQIEYLLRAVNKKVQPVVRYV